MHADIGLMYVEGEVKAGFLTGRTVLVIETTREIDPSRSGYSSPDLKWLVGIHLTLLATLVLSSLGNWLNGDTRHPR